MIGFYDYTVLATYAATALGVTGMFQAVEGRHLTAVFCLLAAGLLDCFDGRIPPTKTPPQQQSFGIQIDSLNDVLCFGALPSVAGYCAWSRWSDAPTPVWYGGGAVRVHPGGTDPAGVFQRHRGGAPADGGRRAEILSGPAHHSQCPGLSAVLPAGLLLPGGPYILAAGMLLLAALYVTPLCIPKPGLAAICLLSAVGALELAGADPGRSGAAVTGRSPVHI